MNDKSFKQEVLSFHAVKNGMNLLTQNGQKHSGHCERMVITMKDKILLFIPGYNCEKQITRVLAQLDENIMAYITKIIVINNRSTDNTEQAVIAYAKTHPTLPLGLLRNDENYNLGGSHKVAFDYAITGGFDYVIVLHGDDQGCIHDLSDILKSGVYRQYDCCLGARFMKNSRLAGYSGFRTFGNRVYNLLFSFCIGRKIYDLGSGLNIYSTNMLKDRFYIKFPDCLTFNYCMILASGYYKHKIKFFPISWREDDQISNVKMLNQAVNVLLMLPKYFFNRHKYIKSEFREVFMESYTFEKIL